MSLCDEYSGRILHYLANELPDRDLNDFRAHLEECANCRANVEAERALSQLLHGSRPLYSAPPAVHARAAAAVEQYSASIRNPQNFYERLWPIVMSGIVDPSHRVARLKLLAATVAIAVLFIALVPNAVRQVGAASYVETAVASHRRYLDGNLALGIRSDSPERVTLWVASKVPFQFRLPNSESTPGSIPTYHLAGAALVSYRGSPAALVIYEKQKEKISLLVASSESAAVAGGDEVRSGALTFHYRIDQGFNVVTWINHGLSYALVSSVLNSARDSCMVCHQNLVDHQEF